MHFDQIYVQRFCVFLRFSFSYSFPHFISFLVTLSLSLPIIQSLMVVIECKENEIKLNQMLQQQQQHIYLNGMQSQFLQQKRWKIESIYNLFVNEWSLWFTVIYDCINIRHERTLISMSECICACSGMTKWINECVCCLFFLLLQYIVRVCIGETVMYLKEWNIVTTTTTTVPSTKIGKHIPFG